MCVILNLPVQPFNNSVLAMEQIAICASHPVFTWKCSTKVKIHDLPRNERARKDIQCVCLKSSLFGASEKGSSLIKEVATTFAD